MIYVLYEVVFGIGHDKSFAIEGTTKDKAVAEAYRKQPTSWSSYRYVEAGELTLEDITQENN